MRTFLGLTVLLFGLFVAGWAWFTGDTRPFEMAFWKQVVYGNGLVGSSTAKANLGGGSSVAKTTKTRAPAAATPAAKPIKLALSRIGSPAGRYVKAKAGSKAKGSAAGGKIIRIGSPVGRYVKAAAIPPPPRKIVSVGSPLGRYVSAPRIMAVKKIVLAAITRVGSPSGRYVKAKAGSKPGKKAGSKPGKIVRVGSPSGRYVGAPAAMVDSGPIIRVGSPSGRYVTAGGSQPSETIPGGFTINTGYGWPAKALADGPRKSAAGALVFPITFEYRKSSFTSSGRKAADQLLAHIKKKNYKRVTLAGHTDSRGSDAVNLRVSKNRLNTVADHLRSGGYKGTLKLVPKGKSQPFDGVDRSKFSDSQLWDLDRRVELVSGS